MPIVTSGTDHHFDLVMVWDNLGGAVRIRRNGLAQVVDPSAGTPVTVTQDGQSTSVVRSDSHGRVTFVAQQGIVKLVADGLAFTAVSAEQATAGADNAAQAQAAQVAAEDARDKAQAAAANTTVINVKDATYGAKGDGVTDDTAAIQAAQAAAASNNTPLFFPNGKYQFNTTLTAQSILGQNRQKTILNYTGTGTAIGVPTAGARTYARRLENFNVNGTGVGVGIDLDAVSSSNVFAVDVSNFAVGVWMHDTSGNGYCLYNTFHEVSVSACTSAGYRFEDKSNENRIIASRATGNQGFGGFDIRSGNHNAIISCAIEGNAGNGVRVYDAGDGLNLTRGTVIAFCRFEGNTDKDYAIFTGVQGTALIANRRINQSTAVSDNGSGTYAIGENGLRAGAFDSASRPSTVVRGAQVFDTTLNKPIWFDGTTWRDATGTAV